MNIGLITIYKEGQTTVEGFLGECTKVKDAWHFENVESMKHFPGDIKPLKTKVLTTARDYKVETFRNQLKVNITEEMWDYNSKVVKKNKKYIQNLPSRTALRQYKISTSKFIRGLSKGFDFTGLENIMTYTHDLDALARFIIYVEDMVSTILNKPDIERTDYKIEFFDLNS